MMRPDSLKISACITCMNEEDKIEACLSSLTWCDEIVVVDSFYTDRTVEICKRYTSRVFQHPWAGYIAQKNVIYGNVRHVVVCRNKGAVLRYAHALLCR